MGEPGTQVDPRPRGTRTRMRKRQEWRERVRDVGQIRQAAAAAVPDAAGAPSSCKRDRKVSPTGFSEEADAKRRAKTAGDAT